MATKRKYSADVILGAIDKAVGNTTTPQTTTYSKSNNILSAIDNAIKPPNNTTTPKQETNTTIKTTPEAAQELINNSKIVPYEDWTLKDKIKSKIKGVFKKADTATKSTLVGLGTPIENQLERTVRSVASIKNPELSRTKEQIQKDNEDVLRSVLNKNPYQDVTNSERNFYNFGNTLGNIGEMVAATTVAGPIAGGSISGGLESYGRGGNLKDIGVNAAKGGVMMGVAGKGSKLVGNILPKTSTMLGNVSKGAVSEGVGFGAGSVASDLTGNLFGEGNTAKQIGQNAIHSAGAGIVLGGIGGAMKPLPNKTLPITPIEEMKIPEAKNEIKNPNNSSVKLSTLSNRLNLVNTPLKNAEEQYKTAIEDIQNYFKTNQLTTNELARIKPELGIDINRVTDNLANAQSKTSKQVLNQLTNNAKLKNASGLGSDSVYNTMNKIAKLPKYEPIKSNNPIIPQTIKATAGLPINNNFEQLTKKEISNLKKTNVVNLEDELAQKAVNWSDKSKPSLIRETMDRNFEDVMGKDAPEFKTRYLDPIRKSETERVKFLNDERNTVKNLNISNKESELVQKYGEGVISIDELKNQTKDWRKVVDATEVFRKKYDEFLPKINEVLIRNGYDPIPKRANYFPHMQEIDGIMSRLGLKLEDLPTDINGLTADFKPGKNFFRNALKRLGNKTEYNAIKGFDRYIEGASKLIYHTDNIQNLRQLDKAIRNKFAGTNHLANFVSNLTEYTNTLAGKKSMLDRGLENMVGRKIYTGANLLKKQVGANMVGANVSSALTNFIPLTQSLATTDKPSFIKGMLETMSSLIKDDGFVTKSDFLTRRMGSDRIATSLWEKASDKANWLFKTIDNFTSETIVRSKYLEGLKKGLSDSQAIKYADDWAAKILADRSLGQTPTLFNSQTMGFLTQFQLEVNNQMSFMFKDIPRNFSKAKAASALAQLFLYGYVFNNLYEKATGRRPAFDPIGITEKAINDYKDKDNKVATKKLVQNMADQLPFTNLFIGGGRIPISSGIPNPLSIATGDSTTKKELSKVPLLMMPFGGNQLKKTYEGLSTFNKGGVYQTNPSGEQYLKYPVEKNTTNKIKGTLFGPSSFKETQNYYNNNERPLSPEQTQKLTKQSQLGQSQQELYNILLEKRQIESEIDKIDKMEISEIQKKTLKRPFQIQLKSPKFRWLNK